MPSKYSRAISANYFFWIVNTLFFLIITPIAIEVMGSELFGLWAILNAIFFSSTVGTLGIGLVVTKFGSEEGDAAPERDALLSAAQVVLLPMALLVAGLLIGLRGVISRHLGIAPAQQRLFSIALVLVGLGVFPQFHSRVFQGYLLSQLRYDLARLVDTGAAIALWVGAVVVAWSSHDIARMAAWGLVVRLLTWLTYLWLVARTGRLRWRWDVGVLRRVGHFSLFTFIQSVAVTLYQSLDRIIVGLVLGPAAAGVYSVGTSVALRLSIVTGETTQLLVPYASRMASLRDGGGLYRTFRRLSRWLDLMLMALGSLLILWMHTILRYWISPSYAASYSGLFRILIFAYLLLSASRPAHQTLVGIGRVRFTALTYLGASAIMLASVWWWSARWGLIGAAASNLWMGLLFSYWLVAHRALAGSVPWRTLIADLATLLGIPVISYGLVTIAPGAFAWRVAVTCVILGIVLVVIRADRELQSRLRGLLPGFAGGRDA